MVAFFDKLRNLIVERGITQKRLAEDLKIPVSTLGGYVQGTSEPDFQTLLLLAGYFGVSTDYLLGVRSNESFAEGEDEILRIFRSLTHNQRAIFIEQGKAFLRANTSKAD